MQQDKWMRLKKMMAVVVSIALWFASTMFSYKGFNLSIPEMSWLGWVLAIAVTVIELVFNTDIQKLNMTLFFSGIVAYSYGIWTNVTGFFLVQGGTFESLKYEPLSILFPVLVGVFLEVVPEPLFVWGIGANDKGDPLGNIFKGQKQVSDWAEFPTRRIEPTNYAKLPKAYKKEE